MDAYNANPSKCTDYWGHLGRTRTTHTRTKPLVLRLLYLAFSFILFAVGFACVFMYPEVDIVKKYLELPGVTLADLQRLTRIVTLDLYICIAIMPLCVVILVYTAYSMLSIRAIWLNFTTVGHVPAEATG